MSHDTPPSKSIFQLALLVTLAIAACTVTTLQASDPVGDRAEHAFLRQLTERQLFSLAERHCRTLLASSVTPNRKAKWCLRLSDTTQKHAWFVDSASRTGLINRSVEDITEFLKVSPPSAEANLQLRLQQVRAFAAEIRMQLVLAEAGHLFGLRDEPVEQNSPVVGQSLPGRNSRAAAERGIELAVALLEQFDTIRSNLDADARQKIRDDARLLLAELHVLNWRSNTNSDDHQQLFQTADSAVSAAARSSRIGHNTARAAWLLAEWKLYSDDHRAFGLHAPNLVTSSSTDEVPLRQFLTIRSLLFRKEARQALKVVAEAEPQTARQRMHLQWLKMEALLGARELAGQLADEPLIAQTSRDFEAERDRVQRVSRGVFGDAIEAVNRRFDLVNEVGSEIADLIEQIEAERDTGDDQSALRLINVALQRLPPQNSQRSRAALQLRAGEILIQQQQWAAARARLKGACADFESVGMLAEQSAADLLRIFAMAQLVDKPRTDDGVSEMEYTTAVEAHVRNFPDQPTAKTASQWLQKIVSVRQPRRAAELSLQQFANATEPLVAAELVLRASDSLQMAADTGKSNDLADLHRQLVQHVAKLLASSRDELPVAKQVRLQVLLLEDQLQVARLQTDQWTEFAATVQRLQALINEAPANGEAGGRGGIADSVRRMQLLELIVSARTTTDVSRLSKLRQQTLEVLDKNLPQTVRFIHSQINGNTLQAGDTYLANLNGQLLWRLVQQRGQQIPIDELRWMLPVAANVAAVSGDEKSLTWLLERVTAMSLNGEQLSSVAQAVASVEQPAKQSPAANSSSAAIQEFWQQVLQNGTQGTDSWLEASLQLAQIAANNGDGQQATRRIGVVETLYPDWGTPARKARAAELLKRLSE
ncbi:hypothetical protein [Fuerstiella marisgermanici]|uniref:Secreted protein n=1 Tax=Fuerstiella marisgermanici TaxID=1891926 RepID=A0A1P8WS12_9PLAN|nr:hypothetical protein [Fuerstiella marisgermanici]APZ96847.1 hypothetical protein Fuma_06521 [Fuerstiella marisgermanici]